MKLTQPSKNKLNNTPVNAYILCGGKSRRMGYDKGFARFENRYFTDWCIQAARNLATNITLITSNDNYKVFGYKLLQDLYKNKGPIAGIYTALQHSNTEWNLILSCDAPGLKESHLKQLFRHIDNDSKLIYLGCNTRDYPLIALYHRDCADHFLKAIQKDDLRLMNCIKSLQSKRIELNIRPSEKLNNINTPAELQNLIYETNQSIALQPIDY